MYPPNYRNPPIVEAVVEFRFAPGVPWAEHHLEQLTHRFQGEYPAPPQQRGRLDVQVGLHGTDVSAQGNLAFQGLLFRSANGTAAVGVGENLLTVHVLAPYPGWASLLPRALSALQLYAQIATPTGLLEVGLRYIDQIKVLAEPNVALAEYFPCIPPKPNAMPTVLNGFHLMTQATDPQDNFVATLTMATVPTVPPDPHLVLLYDLYLVRPFPAPLDPLQVPAYLEFLHRRQRTIFEDSITDRTRELFQ